MSTTLSNIMHWKGGTKAVYNCTFIYGQLRNIQLSKNFSATNERFFTCLGAEMAYGKLFSRRFDATHPVVK